MLPFILRGAKLLGIDSVMCPMDTRRDVWRRLATDMKPAALKAMTREISMGGLPDAFATLLRGAARGRFVVKFWQTEEEENNHGRKTLRRESARDPQVLVVGHRAGGAARVHDACRGSGQ